MCRRSPGQPYAPEEQQRAHRGALSPLRFTTNRDVCPDYVLPAAADGRIVGLPHARLRAGVDANRPDILQRHLATIHDGAVDYTVVGGHEIQCHRTRVLVLKNGMRWIAPAFRCARLVL